MSPQRTQKKIPVGRRPRMRGIDPNTRADILSAARSVFAVRGYDGTSVRSVAEAARVNKAMIYYYFPDKRGLYRSVLADSFDAMRQLWDQARFKTAASAHEKICTFIEGFIRFQRGNEDLRRILTMEYASAGAKSENIRWIAKRYFADNHAALVGVLREGMRRGEIRHTDPDAAVVVLIGMIMHSFAFAPFSPYVQGHKMDVSVRKFGEFVTTLFFEGIGAPSSAGGRRERRARTA